MTTFCLRLPLCLAVTLLSLCVVGCTTKVRLSSTGPTLLPSTVEPDIVVSCWNSITTGKADAATIEKYNKETADVASHLVRKDPAACDTIFLKNGKVALNVDASGIPGFERADKWLISDQVEVSKGIFKRTTDPGIGVPLAIRLQKTDQDALVPETGLWIPATGILKPCEEGLTFKLIDTCGTTSRPNYAGQAVATDFSAPFLCDQVKRQKEIKRLNALIDYDKYVDSARVKRVYGFYPEKIPVVLVHGIFSSTTTWTNSINQLMADPIVRSRFEFWIFEYPTGAPIPFLAKEMRNEIKKMVHFRKANGSNTDQLIVVGHSMGGLMAKTLTQRSGQKQWDRIFAVSPGGLDLAPEEDASLREMFFFEPLPYIDRVIFTATPHHGTETTELKIVDLIDRLIKTPDLLERATEQILLSGTSLLTPLGTQITDDFPTSIDHMRIDSEFGYLFSDLPLNPRVTYHSIIGSENGPDVPKSEMTDGVVRYENAHINGVVSEKIVHSGHGVHRSEPGIDEIARILKSSIGY